MSFTLHEISGALATAGANANATITANTAMLQKWSDEAESMCCAEVNYDLVSNYSSLTAHGKIILSMICDAYVGTKILNYEPGAIGATGAALRLNVLDGQMSKGLSSIKNNKNFLGIQSG